MKKLLATLLILCCAAAPALTQTAITLPIAANAVADLGNGPVKARMIAGNASIFTSQGSGVGSTSGSSTTLTLTATPATPPVVGGLISGSGITSGTTVAAYNGTTGITLSAAMTVASSTPVAWGAACPSSVGAAPVIQASPQADYFIMYTQARVCAVSPGGPVNTLLIEPVFYDGLTNAQLTAQCNVFTSSLSGCAPSSGGGTTNFLRADGSWSAPSSAGYVTGPGTSTVGDIATWSNTAGTLLADTPVLGIAHGGTNGSTASGTLLDNITAFASTGILSRTGAGAYAFRTITGSAPIVVANGDGVAGAPAVSCPTCGTGSGSVTNATIAAGNGILATGTCTITTTGTCTIADDVATNSNIWAGTANKILDAAGAQSAVAPQNIAISTATFTPVTANGINFEITLVHASCPCTLANIASPPVGQSFYLTVIQSATGSDTIGTWGTNYKFSGGTKPTLSTGANAVDILPIYCRTSTFCAVVFAGNFQ